MPKVPDWLSNAIFYQIYPQSFYDSNGDGIGDINGIIEKLDYIEWLGCNAVWINPCFVSPFKDAGYDIADYYKVAPRYGTNADLKRLIRLAKKKDIRICLDLVPGHTSLEHPWFKQSCKAEKNKYSNRYIWCNDRRAESDLIWGYSERPEAYKTNYYWSQPALNYGFANPDPNKPWQMPTDHPDIRALRQEVLEIMKFWLDMGASGFRVDMANSLVKNDKNFRETTLFWRYIRQYIDKHYPQAVLIPEWGDHIAAIKAGFHLDFTLPWTNRPEYSSLFRSESFRNAIYPKGDGHSFFDRLGKGDITRFLDIYLPQYRRIKGKGHISIMSGNHDFTRINVRRSDRELEVIFAFLLTMPGVPFIYYGDEIGMKNIAGLNSKEGSYHRSSARTPMQWSSGRNKGFSKAAKSKLYLPVDEGAYAPDVATYQKKKNSLLNKVRALCKLRVENAALAADGNFFPLYAESYKYPFIYMRKNRTDTYIITLNPADRTVSAHFAVKSINSVTEQLAGSKCEMKIEASQARISMPAMSYAIYKAQ